jgi:hypothetical protein
VQPSMSCWLTSISEINQIFLNKSTFFGRQERICKECINTKAENVVGILQRTFQYSYGLYSLSEDRVDLLK